MYKANSTTTATNYSQARGEDSIKINTLASTGGRTVEEASVGTGTPFVSSSPPTTPQAGENSLTSSEQQIKEIKYDILSRLASLKLQLYDIKQAPKRLVEEGLNNITKLYVERRIKGAEFQSLKNDIEAEAFPIDTLLYQRKAEELNHIPETIEAIREEVRVSLVDKQAASSKGTKDAIKTITYATSLVEKRVEELKQECKGVLAAMEANLQSFAEQTRSLHSLPPDQVSC